MKKIVSIIMLVFVLLKCFGNTLSEKEYKDLEDIARTYFRKTFNGKSKQSGYIYFDGFDFKGYDHVEDGDIQSMLDATLTLLENEYGESKQPFVFVGHSQGGLRALAMSTYLKQKNPELYKQLKGVITLSGIDKGLKLLENQGAVFRSKLHADANILSNNTVTQWLGLED